MHESPGKAKRFSISGQDGQDGQDFWDETRIARIVPIGYVFNGCDNWGNDPAKTTLLDVTLSAVQHPTRTWLMSEWPIHWGFSWHKSMTGNANIPYENAIDNVSFVDGHAAYIKLSYKPADGAAPASYTTPEIPGSYEYQNGPD